MARLRILPAPRPAGAGGPMGAAGPLVARDVEIGAGVDVVRVGRGADLELPLPFPALSAVHARLRREGGAWSVEDAGSTNGTWLGDERLAPGERRPLAPGAELRLGNVRVRFEGEGAPAGAAEGTGTIARRLVDDLFGGAAGAPSLSIVRGAPAGQLALVELGHVYVVGRSEGCALPLAVEEVSREHATVVRGADGVILRDLGSKNGVSVGGARVAGERRLADGDLLAIGPVTLAFDDPAERYLRQLDGAAPAAPVAETPPPPEVAAPTGPPILAAPSAAPRPRATSRLALAVGVSVLLLLAAVVAAAALL